VPKLDVLFSDLQHIGRSLWRRPAFGVAAVLTMTLAMGAVTSIVAVADAVLLRPLSYPRADRLLGLSASVPDPTGRPLSYLLSPVEFVRVRENARTLEQTEAVSPIERALAVDGEPETVQVGEASAGYLRLFGLDPVLGRNFTEVEDRERSAVVVLDGGLWQRRFGSDPSIIGRPILLDGAPYVVIGVTRAGFQPQLQAIDAWTPLGAAVDPSRPGVRFLIGAARLRETSTIDEAQQELTAIQVGVAKDFPQTHSTAHLVVADMHETLYGTYRPTLLPMLGGVGFLLLIACTNVASLTVGRVAERRDEMAVRLALGAASGRILQYQLTETAIIVTIGCVCGLALTAWALPALVAVYPAALPSDISIGIQPRVFGVVCALIGFSTLAAGLVPAWRASSTTAGSLLAHSRTSTGQARDRRAREWLLGGQLGVSVLLLGAAGTLAVGLIRLSQIDPGVDSQSVLTMQLAPPARFPQAQERAAFVARVLDRVREVSGVMAAGTTQTTWQLMASMQTRIEIEGRPLSPDDNTVVHIRHITPGYFEALRVKVTEGRAIDARDAFGENPVAMVSQSFAQRFWAGQHPLGRRFRRTTTGSQWLNVIGVARDVMDSGIGWELGPTIYLPYLQQNTPTARVTLVVRTTNDPTLSATAIQKAIWSVDPRQPIDAVKTVDEAMRESTAQPRFRTMVLMAFATAGLLLACVGVYGVASYGASLRRREIGMRMALGASREQVVALLLWQSLRPVALGIGAGVVLAAAAAAPINRLVNQPEANGMAATALAAGILFACAMVATWLPARRTSRAVPIEAIRQ
jgi:putative ABC transport system permease protein